VASRGVRLADVPSGRDYFVSAHCYEDAGAGMIRHRLGRATIRNLLGSVVVYLQLDVEEIFEDRT
jgi:hypothetical protein